MLQVAALLQADGTLEELVADEAVLQRLLAPLGGGNAAATAAAATASTAEGSPPQQNGLSPAATVNGVQAQLGALAVSSSSSGSNGTAGVAAAAGGSSWRDPDDGVREALAEAIAVLVSYLVMFST